MSSLPAENISKFFLSRRKAAIHLPDCEFTTEIKKPLHTRIYGSCYTRSCRFEYAMIKTTHSFLPIAILQTSFTPRHTYLDPSSSYIPATPSQMNIYSMPTYLPPLYANATQQASQPIKSFSI
jgi:hypothetical protein